MEKLKQYDFILITFVLLGLRALAVEPGVGFALTSMAFASLIGFKRWQEAQAKPDISAEIRKEMEELNTKLSGIMMRGVVKSSQTPPNAEIKRFF